MKADAFRLMQVESFPRPMDAGILYYSQRFNVVGHACACGCGREVITPLSPVQWALRPGRLGPTLRPSIGNWQFPCRSHYWITNGAVEWSYQMSEAKIREGREFNARLRERYFEEQNAAAPPAPQLPAPANPEGPHLMARLIRWLRDLIGGSSTRP